MVMRRQWANVVPRLVDPQGSRPITYPEWMTEGVCAQTDPEAFFPEIGGNPLKAKKLCTTCPVQLACLAWALDNREEHGVWGGTSPGERRRLMANTDKIPVRASA